MIKRILYRPFFIKLLHWEYWPFHVVYAFIYPYWFLLCLRARSFFFFNTSNPTIYNGGFLMESKKAIYDLIPKEYYPGTLLFKAGARIEEIITALKQRKFEFPLIAKPDIGMKGLSVQKVNNEAELASYAEQSKVDFLVQEFISFEQEVGIFYYRYPGEEKGHISGIVRKEFLTVTGDGISTIKSLLKKDKRFVLQLSVLEKTYGDKLQRVLDAGEEFLLVPYGNHARGAKFTDVTHWCDEELRKSIDSVCQRVTGFYFGRMDVRYSSWAELKEGRNFSIVELNGAGSEPTHMYDPRHSLLFAWKEIIRHWNILFRISRANSRILQKPYMKMREGIQMLKANREYVKLISET
jgi:D-alanine-D-alanine ligase-like ATP-grasp enzyme